MNKFWEFKAAANNAGELLIYGEISDVSWWGDEVTPKQFKQELDALGDIDQLDIYINSPGGDVFAGEAIHNMLKRSKVHKTAHVDGLAASIASFILMACDEIIMPENAMVMIHNAWTFMSGNKTDLRKEADILEKIDGVLCAEYAKKTGKTEEEIADLMDAETWLTGKDAFDMGFADRIEAPSEIAACMTSGYAARYKNVPEGIEVTDEQRDHSNRAETQPVDDNNHQPEDRHNNFNELRLKIFETIGGKKNEHF